MNRFRLIWRKAVNVVMLTLTGVAAFSVVSILFLILGYLVYNGGKSLNWAFFTQLPKPVGETGGGMANAIVGSAKLLLLAALIGLPIGLLSGVYLAEFGGRTFGFAVRYTADLLNGVPSIIMGIFAYSLVVLPMRHFSALAGGVALGFMTIPITVRSTGPASGRRSPPWCCRRPRAASSRACSLLSRASPAKPPRCFSPLSETSSGVPAGTSRSLRFP
jgi:ABC-type phosphate transport system permease subunit